MAAKPVPDGFHTVTAHLWLRNCTAAIDFYSGPWASKSWSASAVRTARA